VATTLGSFWAGVPALAERVSIINQGSKPAFVAVRYHVKQKDPADPTGKRVSTYQLTQGWTKVEPNGGSAKIEVGSSSEFFLHGRNLSGEVIPFGTEAVDEFVKDAPFESLRLVQVTDDNGTRETSGHSVYAFGLQLENRVPQGEDPAQHGWHLVTMYKLKANSPVTLMAAASTAPTPPAETGANRPSSTPVSRVSISSTMPPTSPTSVDNSRPSATASATAPSATATDTKPATTSPTPAETKTATTSPTPADSKPTPTRATPAETKPVPPRATPAESRLAKTLHSTTPSADRVLDSPRPDSLKPVAMAPKPVVGGLPIHLSGNLSNLKVYRQQTNKRVALSGSLRWIFCSNSDIVEERQNREKPGVSYRVVGRFTEGRNCQQIRLLVQPEPLDYTVTEYTDGHIDIRISGTTSDGKSIQLEGRLEQQPSEMVGLRVLD